MTDNPSSLRPQEAGSTPVPGGGGSNGWRPIESAPRDGTAILTVVAGFIPDVRQWVEFAGKAQFSPDPEQFMEEDHFSQYFEGTEYRPTHWMPLPSPPATPTEVLVTTGAEPKASEPQIVVSSAAVRIFADADLGAVAKGDPLILSMPRPARHHTILHAMAAVGLPPNARCHDQGFLLSDGTYCDRPRALEIATAAGQLVKNPDAARSPIAPPNLYSEDMW